MSTVSTTVAPGRRPITIVRPSIRDARLHTAAVVMTLHVLGQVALDFAVSVPQIAAAIVTAATIEVTITFARTHQIVWPASAMLTGSGVGLIMRVAGTGAGDHWTWHRWYVFAAVAGASLLTKYLVRWNGRHVFNPSNVGLVVAFVVLGSERVEPLPFRWHPLDAPMAMAYTVVIVGGVAITYRLGLLAMATCCWLALVTGVGVQATAGHCLVVPWQDAAVCDRDLWWTIAASPEVLVFLFFMLTDPRTVPAGRTGRAAFAVAVGMIAAIAIAPQRTEFGAKVALLAALTVTTVLLTGVRMVTARTRATRGARSARRSELEFAAGIAIPVVLIAWAAGQVIVSGPVRSAGFAPVVAVELPPLDAVPWDPPALPPTSADARAVAFDATVADPAVRAEIVEGLLRALHIEAEAIRRHDPELLRAATHGRRIEVQRQAIADGAPPAMRYEFSTARITVVHAPGQAGALLAVEATGTASADVRAEAVEVVGAGAAAPTTFRLLFTLRPADDGRWLIADVSEPVG